MDLAMTLGMGASGALVSAAAVNAGAMQHHGLTTMLPHVLANLGANPGLVAAMIALVCAMVLVLRNDPFAVPALTPYPLRIAPTCSDRYEAVRSGAADFRVSSRVTDLRQWWDGWPHRAESDRRAGDPVPANDAGAEHAGAKHEGLARRFSDIGLSILLLAASLPLVAVVALLIKLDSRGPVFYRQERVGLRGKCFQLIKFRSMRADAEAQSGPQWAVEADPRVTRVGAILRLTRIDELPQIWNVLRGEMSLIGPRPERPYFVSQLATLLPRYHDRSIVKPGITGWAQVNYRYGASVEDARIKLAYDLYYVRHRSILLDLRILAATVRVVLLRQGAR